MHPATPPVPVRPPDEAPSSGGRVLLVANRLPVTIVRRDGALVVERSVGGLATGLAGPHARSGGVWIGWPGLLDDVDATERLALGDRLSALRAAPVELTAAEVEQFYEGISNGVLWPVFHDRLDRLPLVVEGWETYEAVNARFADAVAAQWRPGDVVWVHDYQLLRVPALLRARIPEARIGFFLHIPFPPADVFAALPTRRWLLEGLLGADLVGFHTARYRAHFVEAVRRFAGDPSADARAPGDATDATRGERPPVLAPGDEPLATLRLADRAVRLGVFPMSVDARALAERAGTREVTAATLALREPSLRLLVGIDRLDYSKGIPRRLLAFEQLLLRHPEWRERVRLVQVAVPSRVGVAEYQQFREQLDALVGRINGAFATPSWTPIHYLYRAVDETTLLALYRAADVLLVTPVRDGMNLVAKEFVATRADEGGVLVLSEFAGAAAELHDALLVNPYDVQGTADAMHRGLTMDAGERRRRMAALRAQVAAHDVDAWADRFVDALAAIPGPVAAPVAAPIDTPAVAPAGRSPASRP